MIHPSHDSLLMPLNSWSPSSSRGQGLAALQGSPHYHQTALLGRSTSPCWAGSAPWGLPPWASGACRMEAATGRYLRMVFSGSPVIQSKHFEGSQLFSDYMFATSLPCLSRPTRLSSLPKCWVGPLRDERRAQGV